MTTTPHVRTNSGDDEMNTIHQQMQIAYEANDHEGLERAVTAAQQLRNTRNDAKKAQHAKKGTQPEQFREWLADKNTGHEPKDYDKETHGQTRFAQRLAVRYTERLLHVENLGWYHWDGTRWAEDGGGKRTRRAITDILRRAWREAQGDPKFARQVENANSAPAKNGIMVEAAALPELTAEAGDLDADPWLLNTPAGLLNLETSKVIPHDPAARCTHITTGSYRPGCVEGSEWAKFLETTLPDPEVRAFLARYVGVGLLGEVREHKLAILTGAGRNGKGVFYGALDAALGDYAVVGEKELLLHREHAHPTGEMDLRGARWVVVSETDQGRKLAEATVKRLTGGDKIRARRMRQDFVEFTPSHSLALVTNHLPEVEGEEVAMWDRLRVVPFEQSFRGRNADPELPRRLLSEAEADAIITWAVEGWLDYRARGPHGSLDEPRAVVQATGDYQANSDTIGDFLDEATTAPVQGPVRATQLYEAYVRWAKARGITKPQSKVEFGKSLDRRMGPATRSAAGNTRPLGLRQEWVS